jgi:pilus assembly protein CpaC
MIREIPGSRRAPLRAAGPIAGIAAALCAVAGAALAVENAPRTLVPSGSRGMIQLESASTTEDVVRLLDMEKGKSVIVRTDYSVTRVSVGDPRVADVVVLRTQEIQIVAKEVGTTNVVLWGGGGEIEAAIDLHVGHAFSSIESEIRRVIEVGDVRVSAAGASVVLTGSVPDAVSVERAVNIARAYFPEKGEGGIINLLDVGGNQQVMIEVTVSEVNRDLRKEIGTNFAASIINDGDQVFEVFNLIDRLAAPEVIDPVGPEVIEFADTVNLIGTAFPIGTGTYALFVNALDETGAAKILAEPTLVARTGETARFLSGGEVPIPVAQGGAFGSITVDYKEFGVGLAFTPTVLSENRIHLDVTTEVSQVDFGLGTAVSGTAAPGFRTRRATTGVEVGDGQTFAIAGLLRDELTENVSMYPFLGEIPILGMLFRVSTYQKQTSELVLLVRPRLVKPLGPDAPPLPTDYFDEPNWFEFYMLGRTEGFDSRVAAAPEAEPEAGFVGDAGYRLPASPDEAVDEEETE